jgi:S1-C subfamily serine protease
MCGLMACAATQAWPVSKLEPSIGRLTTDEPALCTAFSIHAKEARWITAAHCLTKGIQNGLVNQLARVVKILETDETNDGLAVFETSKDYERYPALKLGPRPAKGDEVLLMGFGGGAPQLLFYEGLFQMSVIFNEVPVEVYSAPAMRGMSGGPVIDRRGRVVGVVVGGAQTTQEPVLVSFSPQYTRLAELMKKYAQ